MALSGTYGPANDIESMAVIGAAVDAGVTMLDTADFYGMGHNELLLRKALTGVERDKVFIAVKFGAQWGPDRTFLGVDARPVSVKNYLAYTLRRLRTDYVDLYQPARVDPAVPIEDTVGAIAELVQAGYVRHVGLSEASAETIRRAHAVHPIAALQMEYSLLSRGVEACILPTLRELGIALVAYGVLSRGLLGGRLSAASGPLRDARAHMPRFQGENLAHNLSLVAALREIAEEKGVGIARLAMAWVLSRGDDIIPLIGARHPDQLTDAVLALDVTLSAEDLARIDRAVPAGAAAGDRYHAAHMAALDSERSAVH
jgi:aryl-alcohol dehydrogenase-like predicted oxidoreductase